MRRAVRVGVAAVVLASASPALASDFSGIARVFWWAIAAGCVLIALTVTFIRRLRHPGTPEGDMVLSIAAAVILAPAVLVNVDGQWLPTPFPGLAIALLDGAAGLLFPVPLMAMVLCWFGLSRLLARLRARHETGEDAPSSSEAVGRQETSSSSEAVRRQDS